MLSACALVVLLVPSSLVYFLFFFNDTATTEIYTLSPHDALPISTSTSTATISVWATRGSSTPAPPGFGRTRPRSSSSRRSEEHTSELQSRLHLVCRLLLEKKKKNPDKLSNVDDRFDLVRRLVPTR